MTDLCHSIVCMLWLGLIWEASSTIVFPLTPDFYLNCHYHTLSALRLGIPRSPKREYIVLREYDLCSNSEDDLSINHRPKGWSGGGGGLASRSSYSPILLLTNVKERTLPFLCEISFHVFLCMSDFSCEVTPIFYIILDPPLDCIQFMQTNTWSPACDQLVTYFYFFYFELITKNRTTIKRGSPDTAKS